MAGTKSSIVITNTDFAQNGTQQLVHFAGAPAKKRGRKFGERDGGELPAAAQFMLLCEQEHKLPRRAFRELMIRALKEQGECDERRYFTERETVFNDWFYPARAMPTWANQILVEIMFGMLSDPLTSNKLRIIIRKYLGMIIEEIAGGSNLYRWMMSSIQRLECTSGTHRGGGHVAAFA